jgi:hypothetical protein
MAKPVEATGTYSNKKRRPFPPARYSYLTETGWGLLSKLDKIFGRRSELGWGNEP